jgi:NAD(P)-dependent dehydrogenase (short-subunit alcohol dehydrogenase family)
MCQVTSENMDALGECTDLDIVVWAQGLNTNDNIHSFDDGVFEEMMKGNVEFVLKTLRYLLENGCLREGAKMVVVSSVYQNVTRKNKLSYSITKSALKGLIMNLGYDLATKNMLINAVLPGVIDNEMTWKTLMDKEMKYIRDYTGFGRLVTLEDVWNTVWFLVNGNTGITGQSVVVDLGFTNLMSYS